MAIVSEENRRSAFTQELETNFLAAIGVTFVKTLDPFRVQDATVDIALGNERPAYLWDMMHGWREYDHAVAGFQEPTAESMKTSNALAALNGLSDRDDSGIFIMEWPQHLMKNMPQVTQRIGQLSRSLPDGNQRLVLIVPMDFEMPTEIREMVSVMEFSTPGRSELRDKYYEVLEGIKEEKRPDFSTEEVNSILNVAIGLTELEAETAFSLALIRNRSHMPSIPLENFMAVVAEAKTEAVKRSDVLELMPSGDINDIGGLDALKEWVSVTARCMTEEARDAGVDQPRGILLAGPPGTGKSVSAKAIASVMHVPLIRLDLSRIFSGIVGSSESRAKQAMSLISSMAPCVAMVDEIDKVFNVNAGQGDSGVGMRVLGTLLTHMQESDDGVFWVFTANRVDGLPPELLRKGRLDELFSVSVPNDEERREVLRIHLEKRGYSLGEIGDVESIVDASAGYVPVELESAVKEAIKLSFANEVEMTAELVKEQLGNMKPLSQAFQSQFEAMQEWAENNARPASSGPAPARASASTPPSNVGGGGGGRRRRRRMESD